MQKEVLENRLKMNKNIYFFIGTEAELIKVFPVMIECQNNGMTCNLIASGQNDIMKSRIMEYIHLNGKTVELSLESDIKKSAIGLLSWFCKTKKRAISLISELFDVGQLKNQILIVHGDTVSTMMGAMIGKKLEMRICHVEAGLRSHNLFNPFPEEIDRLITSKKAQVHFAPGTEATKNLEKAKGKVINTKYNTILDSLYFSRNIPIATEKVAQVMHEDYFVFVMHRQENLMNKEFVVNVVERVEKLAEKRKCIIILHKITENVFNELGILQRLKENTNVVLLPRVDYFDFMKLLNGSKYVITDGGSNQEELHYMGKPCLIMRKTTERNEGIGQNARLFNGNVDDIIEFANEYANYEIAAINQDNSPSKCIAKELISLS